MKKLLMKSSGLSRVTVALSVNYSMKNSSLSRVTVAPSVNYSMKTEECLLLAEVSTTWQAAVSYAWDCAYLYCNLCTVVTDTINNGSESDLTATSKDAGKTWVPAKALFFGFLFLFLLGYYKEAPTQSLVH
jgi:hypothetical protein